MRDDFPHKVGDRVKQPGDLDEMAVTITAIGREAFLAITRTGDEIDFTLEREWVLVPPPIQRFIVEVRPVQPGEQYLRTDQIYFPMPGTSPVRIYTYEQDQPSAYDQIVIVDDLTGSWRSARSAAQRIDEENHA